MEKLCKFCGQTKPVYEFYTDPQTKDGFCWACKVCQRLRVKKYRKERPSRFQGPNGTKYCYKCKIFRPTDNFGESHTEFDGRQRTCTDCVFLTNFRRRLRGPVRNHTPAYKIIYERLFDEQDGRCAICRNTVPGKRKRFCLDHCHTTGNLRGLLCDSCNWGIGYFKDDPALFQAAIDYVVKHHQAACGIGVGDGAAGGVGAPPAPGCGMRCP